MRAEKWAGVVFSVRVIVKRGHWELTSTFGSVPLKAIPFKGMLGIS